MSLSVATQLAYLLASVLFIAGLRDLSHPESARRGLLFAQVGMLLAVVGTLLQREIVRFEWIIAGIALGSIIGTLMSAWIPMTKMPERIALSHAFGGLAVALVGVSEFYHRGVDLSAFQLFATSSEVFLGGVTFTGSLVAFGKLQGMLPGRPLAFPGQTAVNAALLATCLGLIAALTCGLTAGSTFYVIGALGVVLGTLLVVPVGGADMPVIICLLNAYAGLAASATGFALENNVLIICGALDGGSGLILGLLMSKAMNRSFSNVLLGRFGQDASATSAQAGGVVAVPNEASVDEACEVLKVAQSVIVVPGYGMAVSQAQHAVRELAAALQALQASVRYAIHPVAGRMPGHMNVLLAEANIPYEQLFDLEAINDDFSSTDVAIVVGANDVVNPAAKNSPTSPIFGMPILHVDHARTVIVLKRSMNPGFAGIENQLFTRPNTLMVLGDAKKTLLALTNNLKGTGQGLH